MKWSRGLAGPLIKKASHHILVRALDFVCPPGLSVVAGGHFVGLDILGAADSLGPLGYQPRDPHPSLQVYLGTEREKERER